MSTSRYSAKAQKRDRQALFSVEDLSKSPSPLPLNTSSAYVYNEDNVHAGSEINTGVSTPYERPKHVAYSAKAAEMAMLESQSDESMNTMKYKLGALKDLSLAMGEQINKSKKNLSELGDDMGLSSEQIKWNMGRMRRFVEKSGVGWRVWGVFSIIILWLFFWVWLF